MMGNETKLLRNKLKTKLPKFLFAQIESPKTAPGFPDTDYIRKGSANDGGKIELKYESSTPSRIDLRSAQCVWLRRYARHGGKCFVMVRVGSDFIYMWPGKYALHLKKGEDIYQLEHWKFNIKRDGWDAISDIL